MKESRLTPEQRDTLLFNGLPYHMEGLMLMAFAAEQMDKVSAVAGEQLCWEGKPIAPNILINALLEAGAVHLRYVAEFLGLTVSAAGKRLQSKARQADDLRIDDLCFERCHLESLRWDEVSEDKNLGQNFADALEACLVASNKLVAHPTIHLVGDEHRAKADDIRVAIEGLLCVLINEIYVPLEIAEALLDEKPVLRKFVWREKE